MKRELLLLSVLWLNTSQASLTSDTSDPFGQDYKIYKTVAAALLNKGTDDYPSFEAVKNILADSLDPALKDDFLTGLSFLYELGTPKHPGGVVTDGFICLSAKVLYAKNNGAEKCGPWQELALLQLLAFHKSALEGLLKSQAFEESSARKTLLTTYLSKIPTFSCPSCRETALSQQFDIKPKP